MLTYHHGLLEEIGGLAPQQPPLLDTPTAPKKQYVPDQVQPSAALYGSGLPGPQALVQRSTDASALPKIKGPQFVPDILKNPLQPSLLPPPPVDRLPLVVPQRPGRQVLIDILFNPVALASTPAVGGAPFIPTSLAESTADKQFLPEQAFNPLVPGAGAETAPFLPTSLAESTTDKQYIPDQVINPIALPAGTPPPVTYGQSAIGQLPPPKKQYIPEQIGANVSLLTAPPMAPVKAGQSALDQLYPKKQFVPDQLINPVALAAGRPPFRPDLNEQPKAHKQFIPEQVINTTCFTTSVTTELLYIARRELPPDRPIKRYVPDILFNPVALPLSPPAPAPFFPGLNEQPKAGKQYVPDILTNPVALSTGVTAPFISFAYPEFPARKQYITEVLSNPMVPPGFNPFRPDLNEQPKGHRQYVADQVWNPILIGIPLPPPVIPPVTPPVIPPPVPPPSIPPPTQQSSKTVSSISIPYLQVVMDMDPTFQRDKHRELFYPFGEAGHRARDFYGDPYASGAYTPPQPGSPTDTALPVITGGAFVGSVLSVSTGTWTGSPTIFTYRWFGNGNPITGATLSTFVPTVGNIGQTITAGVSAINGFGVGAEAISAPVGPIRPGGLLTDTSGGLMEGPGGALTES